MTDYTKELAAIASKVRQEVESLAKPGERWTVNNSPRVSITLWNPREETSGRGRQVDASNCDDIESIVNELRQIWADNESSDEEYAKNLIEKCG